MGFGKCPNREAEEQIPVLRTGALSVWADGDRLDAGLHDESRFRATSGEDGCRLIQRGGGETAVALGLADTKVAVAEHDRSGSGDSISQRDGDCSAVSSGQSKRRHAKRDRASRIFWARRRASCGRPRSRCAGTDCSPRARPGSQGPDGGADDQHHRRNQPETGKEALAVASEQGRKLRGHAVSHGAS